MQITLSVAGGFADWIPFGSPVDLHGELSAAIRREGWIPLDVSLGEVRDPLSVNVTYAGSVTVSTLSANREAIRSRVASMLFEITGRSAVVTVPALGEPTHTTPEPPSLNSTLVLVALIAAIGLAIVIKVRL